MQEKNLFSQLFQNQKNGILGEKNHKILGGYNQFQEQFYFFRDVGFNVHVTFWGKIYLLKFFLSFFLIIMMASPFNKGCFLHMVYGRHLGWSSEAIIARL